VKLNDDTPIWTRIGAAWAHKKAPGFSIQLDALSERLITARRR